MTYLILLHKRYLFNFKLTYLIMKRLTPEIKIIILLLNKKYFFKSNLNRIILKENLNWFKVYNSIL